MVDDRDGVQRGKWTSSTSTGRFLGTGYLHDGNEGQGEKTVTLTAKVKQAGSYDVRLAYTPNPNRATNVAVTVHAGVTRSVTINQQKSPKK